MAQNNLEIAAAETLAVLVKLEWGVEMRRYARWQDNIVITGDGTYLPEPSVSVTLPTFDGSTDEQMGKMRIDARVEPADKALRGYAHAPISCTVKICSALDPDNTVRTLLTGKMHRGVLNPSGRAGIAQFEISTLKSRLDRSLGLFANPSCEWIFGDAATCRYDLAAVTINDGTISSLGTPNRNSVMVGLGASPPGLAAALYARGYIEVAGLRVLIRRMIEDGGNTYLELTRIPPPEWDGATGVTIAPGCNKQLATCRQYGNEDNHNAPGSGIPSQNPLFRV